MSNQTVIDLLKRIGKNQNAEYARQQQIGDITPEEEKTLNNQWLDISNRIGKENVERRAQAELDYLRPEIKPNPTVVDAENMDWSDIAKGWAKNVAVDFPSSAVKAAGQTGGAITTAMGANMGAQRRLFGVGSDTEADKDLMQLGYDIDEIANIAIPGTVTKNPIKSMSDAWNRPWGKLVKQMAVGIPNTVANEALPAMAPAVAAFAASNLFGGPSAAGRWLAGTTAASMPILGGVVQDQMRNNDGQVDLPRAYAATALSAPMEGIGPAVSGAMTKGLIGKYANIADYAASHGVKDTLKVAGKTAVATGLGETLTEMPQEITEYIGGKTRKQIEDEMTEFDPKWSETVGEYVDKSGNVIGSILGTADRLFQDPVGAAEKVYESPLAMQALKAGGMGFVVGGGSSSVESGMDLASGYKEWDNNRPPLVDTVDENDLGNYLSTTGPINNGGGNGGNGGAGPQDFQQFQGQQQQERGPVEAEFVYPNQGQPQQTQQQGQPQSLMQPNQQLEQGQAEQPLELPFVQVEGQRRKEGTETFPDMPANPTMQDLDGMVDEISAIQDPDEKKEQWNRFVDYTNRLRTSQGYEQLPTLEKIGVTPKGEIRPVQRAQIEQNLIDGAVQVNEDPNVLNQRLQMLTQQAQQIQAAKDTAMRNSINNPADIQTVIKLDADLKTMSNAILQTQKSMAAMAEQAQIRHAEQQQALSQINNMSAQDMQNIKDLEQMTRPSQPAINTSETAPAMDKQTFHENPEPNSLRSVENMLKSADATQLVRALMMKPEARASFKALTGIALESLSYGNRKKKINAFLNSSDYQNIDKTKDLTREREVLDAIVKNHKSLDIEGLLQKVTSENLDDAAFMEQEQAKDEGSEGGNLDLLNSWKGTKQEISQRLEIWKKINKQWLSDLSNTARDTLFENLGLPKSWSLTKSMNHILRSKRMEILLANARRSGIDLNKLPLGVQRHFDRYANNNLLDIAARENTKSINSGISEVVAYNLWKDAIMKAGDNATQLQKRKLLDYQYINDKKPSLDYQSQSPVGYENRSQALNIFKKTIHPIEINGVKYFGFPMDKKIIGSHNDVFVAYAKGENGEGLTYLEDGLNSLDKIANEASETSPVKQPVQLNGYTVVIDEKGFARLIDDKGEFVWAGGKKEMQSKADRINNSFNLTEKEILDIAREEYKPEPEPIQERGEIMQAGPVKNVTVDNKSIIDEFNNLDLDGYRIGFSNNKDGEITGLVLKGGPNGDESINFREELPGAIQDNVKEALSKIIKANTIEKELAPAKNKSSSTAPKDMRVKAKPISVNANSVGELRMLSGGGVAFAGTSIALDGKSKKDMDALRKASKKIGKEVSLTYEKITNGMKEINNVVAVPRPRRVSKDTSVYLITDGKSAIIGYDADNGQMVGYKTLFGNTEMNDPVVVMGKNVSIIEKVFGEVKLTGLTDRILEFTTKNGSKVVSMQVANPESADRIVKKWNTAAEKLADNNSKRPRFGETPEEAKERYENDKRKKARNEERDRKDTEEAKETETKYSVKTNSFDNGTITIKRRGDAITIFSNKFSPMFNDDVAFAKNLSDEEIIKHVFKDNGYVSHNVFGEENVEPEEKQEPKPGKNENEISRGKSIAFLSDTYLNLLNEAYLTDKPITKAMLFEHADKEFDGTKSEGKYSEQDAMEALEIAVNIFTTKNIVLGDGKSRTDSVKAFVKTINEKIFKNIPTQTTRTTEKDEYQQFSTPPHLAAVVGWLAGPKDNSVILEPSAGTGSLIAGALGLLGKYHKAKVYANEYSERRADALESSEMGDKISNVTTLNAEHLDNFYIAKINSGEDIKRPTIVVMNPPFSSTAGRITGERNSMNATKHINAALNLLREGGRLVTIVGNSMAYDNKRFKPWFNSLKANYTVMADVLVNGREYMKYGTTFDNRIIVIDKIATPEGHNPYVNEFNSITDILNDKTMEALSNDYLQREIKPESVESSNKQESNTTAKDGEKASIGKQPDTSMEDLGAIVSGQRGNSGGRPKTRTNTGSGIENGATTTNANTRNGDGSGSKLDRSPDGLPDSAGNGTDGISTSDRDKRKSINDEASKAKSGTSKSKVNTSGIFSEYKPSVEIDGSKKHPGNLVESTSLASVSAPDIDYVVSIPRETITSGKLSDAQLEVIARAGAVFQKSANDNVREGFLIGDGTGVGKGREIPGIMWDNMNKGDKRALWITKNSKLVDDIKDHINGIGWTDDVVVKLPVKYDTPIRKNGVLGVTYSALVGKSKQNETRLDMIKEWLGPDFDGVIAFDEAHLATDKKSGSNIKKSRSYEAIQDLKATFPMAKIVYSSATIASNPTQMAILDRLRLWGEGTAFRTFEAFSSAIEAAGVSAMEMMTMNMKTNGNFLARTLSYNGVKYRRLEHNLNREQTMIYEKYGEAWKHILDSVEALSDANDGAARMFNRGNFWSANLRFWNQVITSLQTETAIKDMEAQLKDGKAVVIQLTNTNASGQDRALDNLSKDQTLDDFDTSPSQMIVELLESNYPIHVYEEFENDDGYVDVRLVRDEEGSPLIDQEKLQQRDNLIAEINSIKKLGGPLSIIIDHFGADNVAEVTGRSRRVLTKNGQRIVETRGSNANKAEIEAFLDAKKMILVFSEAGGTGASYHSGLEFKNQQQRMHYLLQAGWRADVAIQGLGRDHRTNQASAPEYILVTTDVPAQARFLSTIAMRLEKIGALTTGERKSTGQGLFSEKDNLEGPYARRAIASIAYKIFHGNSPITPAEIRDEIRLTNNVNSLDYSNFVGEGFEMRKLLNRLLSSSLGFQKKFFDLVMKEMSDIIDVDKSNGTYNNGTNEIPHVGAKEGKVVEVKKDGKKVNVKYHAIDTKIETYRIPYEKVMSRKEGDFIYNANARVNKISVIISDVRFVTTGGSAVLVEAVTTVNPKGQYNTVPLHEIGSKFSKLSEAEAKRIWNEEHDAIPKIMEKTVHMFSGSLLNVWNELSNATYALHRIVLDNGESVLGRIVFNKDINRTLSDLGIEGKVMSEKDILKLSLSTMDQGRSINLGNRRRMRISTVRMEQRLELLDVPFMDKYTLQDMGFILERFGSTDRYFYPLKNAKKGVTSADVKDMLKKLGTKITQESSSLVDEDGSGDLYSFEYLAMKSIYWSVKNAVPMIRYGVRLIGEGLVNIKSWSKTMIKKFGIQSRKILQSIYNDALAFVQANDIWHQDSFNTRAGQIAQVKNLLMTTKGLFLSRDKALILARELVKAQGSIRLIADDMLDGSEQSINNLINSIDGIKKDMDRLKKSYSSIIGSEGNENNYNDVVELIRKVFENRKGLSAFGRNVKISGLYNAKLNEYDKVLSAEGKKQAKLYSDLLTSEGILSDKDKGTYLYFVPKDKLSTREKAFAKVVKKAFGIDTVFYFSNSNRSGYTLSTEEAYKNNIFVNVGTYDIMQVFMHELVHHMQKNEKLYRQLQDSVASIDQAIVNEAFQSYDDRKLSPERIEREKIAKLMGVFFSGDRNTINKLGRTYSSSMMVRLANIVEEKLGYLLSSPNSFPFDGDYSNLVKFSNDVHDTMMAFARDKSMRGLTDTIKGLASKPMATLMDITSDYFNMRMKHHIRMTKKNSKANDKKTSSMIRLGKMQEAIYPVKLLEELNDKLNKEEVPDMDQIAYNDMVLELRTVLDSLVDDGLIQDYEATERQEILYDFNYGARMEGLEEVTRWENLQDEDTVTEQRMGNREFKRQQAITKLSQSLGIDNDGYGSEAYELLSETVDSLFREDYSWMSRDNVLTEQDKMEIVRDETEEKSTRLESLIEEINGLDSRKGKQGVTEASLRWMSNLYSIEYLAGLPAYIGYKLAKKAMTYGVNLMSKGIKKFSKWSSAMINKYGPTVKKYIDSLYSDALKVLNSRRGMIRLGKFRTEKVNGTRNTDLSFLREDIGYSSNFNEMQVDGSISSEAGRSIEARMRGHLGQNNAFFRRLVHQSTIGRNREFKISQAIEKVGQYIYGSEPRNDFYLATAVTAAEYDDTNIMNRNIESHNDTHPDNQKISEEMIRYVGGLYSIEYLAAKTIYKGFKIAKKALEYGISLMDKAISPLAQWSKDMIKKFGESVNPFLKSLYDDAKKVVKSRRGGISVNDYATKGKQPNINDVLGKGTMAEKKSKIKAFMELFYKAHSDISLEQQHFINKMLENPSAKSVEEMFRNMTIGISKVAETEKAKYEKMHIRGDNSKIISTVDKILTALDSTGDSEFSKWASRTVRSMVAPLIFHSQHQKKLFRLAERLWWNGTDLQFYPGFRELNANGDKYRYVRDSIPESSVLGDYSKLIPFEKQMLIDRAIKNEEYRLRQVNVGNQIEMLREGVVAYEIMLKRFAAGKITQLDKQLREALMSAAEKLSRASDDDIRYYRASENEIKNILKRLASVDAMLQNIEAKVLNGKYEEMSVSQDRLMKKEFDNRRKLVSLAATNMGHFGYAHHTGFDAVGLKDNVSNGMDDYNSMWHSSIPASKKFRAGKEGFIENLFNADLAQSVSEGKSRVVNNFLAEVEATYGIRTLGISSQEDLNEIAKSEGYSFKDRVIALYGKNAGHEIFLPKEVYDIYSKKRGDKNNLDESSSQIMAATEAFSSQFVSPMNFWMLYHPGKFARDLIAASFNLLHLGWVEFGGSESISDLTNRVVAFAKAIKGVASPSVWNRITRAEMAEYSEANLYTASMNQHWTSKALDKASLIASQKLGLEEPVALGTLLARFVSIFDLAGAGDIPVKRFVRLYAEEAYKDKFINKVDRDRKIRKIVKKFAFDTKDLPPAAKFVRGQMNNDISKFSGHVMSGVAPFFGWAYSLGKSITIDSVTDAYEKGKKQGLRYALPDLTAPIMFGLLALAMARGLIPPFEDEEESVAKNLEGIKSKNYKISSSNRGYIGKGKDGKEYHIWLKSMPQTSLAMSMARFGWAMAGMPSLLTPLDAITQPFSDMVSISPLATTGLSMMEMTNKYNKYNKKENDVVRLLTALAIPQSIRFGPALAKFRTMNRTDGGIPNTRDMTMAETAMNQLGMLSGELQRDEKGNIIKRSMSNELLKEFAGINIKEVEGADLAVSTKREMESVYRDSKKIIDAEKWTRNNKVNGVIIKDPITALKKLGLDTRYKKVDNAIQEETKLLKSRVKGVLKAYDIQKARKTSIPVKNKVINALRQLGK